METGWQDTVPAPLRRMNLDDWFSPEDPKRSFRAGLARRNQAQRTWAADNNVPWWAFDAWHRFVTDTR